MIVYNLPEGWKQGDPIPAETLRFTFPRQREGRGLCISDFFLSKSSGKMDVLGMSCVTIGAIASHETQKLFEGGEYTKYLYLHGLSVETAEALAEFSHKMIREELGIAGDDAPHMRDLFHQKYRGSRYSFGYPACPNLEDQTKLFALLHPDETIGVQLTTGFLLDPEQSTSAIDRASSAREVLRGLAPGLPQCRAAIHCESAHPVAPGNPCRRRDAVAVEADARLLRIS